MAVMTPTSTGLRAIWGTVLYIWMQGAWAVLVATGLLQIVWAVMANAGLLMPTDEVDGTGWGVIALVIALLNGVAYWWSHHVMLMPRTRRVTKNRDPYLYGIVSEQARLAGLPMPKVIESPFFTASAIGRNPKHAVLGVSSTLQCKLNRRELAAVLAHELAHVKNHDALIMTVTMTVVGFVLGVSLLVGFYGWIGALVLLLSLMSWLRESHADTTAACVSGDSVALASALNKLPRSSFLSFLLSPYTHPPTKLRVWHLKTLAKRNV